METLISSSSSSSIKDGSLDLSDSESSENEFLSNVHLSRTAFKMYVSLDFLFLLHSLSNQAEKYSVSFVSDDDVLVVRRLLSLSGPCIKIPRTILCERRNKQKFENSSENVSFVLLCVVMMVWYDNVVCV
mgnify:FL=1